MNHKVRFLVTITAFFSLMGKAMASATASHKPESLGAIAEHLVVGTGIVTRLMWVICFAVGLSFIMMSFSFYKAHRFNPRMVPISKPILYLVLGFCLLAIPFLNRVFGETGSVFDYEKKSHETSGLQIHDIDAPLHDGNEHH